MSNDSRTLREEWNQTLFVLIGLGSALIYLPTMIGVLTGDLARDQVRDPLWSEAERVSQDPDAVVTDDTIDGAQIRLLGDTRVRWCLDANLGGDPVLHVTQTAHERAVEAKGPCPAEFTTTASE